MPINQDSQGGTHGGASTGLGGTTAAILVGFTNVKGEQGRKLTLRVAATGAFRLNLFFTPDGGTNYYIAKQVTSAAVTVDGGTASYTSGASLDEFLSSNYKVEIYNTTGGNIDYAFDFREYTP